MKTAPELAPLGQRVTRIRRTRVGDLLLELGRSGDETPELKEAISSNLKDSAEVVSLIHRQSINILYLDEAVE